jgi:hypothetical protein
MTDAGEIDRGDVDESDPAVPDGVVVPIQKCDAEFAKRSGAAVGGTATARGTAAVEGQHQPGYAVVERGCDGLTETPRVGGHRPGPVQQRAATGRREVDQAGAVR